MKLSEESRSFYEQESEVTMAAEREDIMRMALQSNPDDEEGSYCGGHQLNQREVSFGHDDESARESMEMYYKYKKQSQQQLPSHNSSNQ